MNKHPEFEDISSSSKFSRTTKNASKRKSYLKNKKIRQRIRVFNILTSFVLIVCIIITAAMGVLIYYTGDLNIGSINSGNLGISAEAAKLPKGVTNIALFGIDSRSRDAQNRTEALSGRSDTVIVLSINTIDGTVKLTSLLRDSWVYIDGGKKFKGYDKLNAAYSHGGPELAIKTINSQFGLNISDYVALSLLQLQEVIDIMGGIDIHITEAERVALNGLANSEGYNVKPLYQTGYVHLDGGQAMMYSRIRKIDSEGNRALRQQKVLSCLFEKAKKLPISQYPGVLKEMLQYVETSLSYDEIFGFSPILSKGIKLQSTSIPGDEVIAYGGVFEDTRGGWVWKYDLNEAKDYIIDWIYGKQ
ncbi:MAG: LytR family transcriptional regulator [Ruminococcaceae bacterium]|nr:LytR family transcriptional regulator [Oscillospiraceae bacterium]